MYTEIDSLSNTCFLGLSAQMVYSLFLLNVKHLKHTIRIKLKIDVLYDVFFI